MNSSFRDVFDKMSYLYYMEESRLENEVNYIIQNRITDSNVIERCLDSLNNVPSTKASILAANLCAYYNTIGTDNSKGFRK